MNRNYRHVPGISHAFPEHSRSTQVGPYERRHERSTTTKPVNLEI